MILILAYYRLVGGAGQVKITKDGNVLLHEMVNKLKIALLWHYYIDYI